MKAALILLICLSTSCKILKYSLNEKIISKENCASISSKRLLILDAEIENNREKFVFDSGAMASAVIDSTVIRDFKNKKFATFGSHYGADRKKKKNKIIPFKIKSELFESDNKMMLCVQSPISACSKESAVKGIIGLDAFFDNELSLFLDFSNSKVCNINAQQFQKLLTDNLYQVIKSKCKKNQIFVYLNIEGNEYPFKLDTGYTGSIVMPFDEKLAFKNKKKMELEGSLFQTISAHTSGQEVIYEKMPVTFGQYNLQAKMTVSTSIKAQNIGIDFIKAFDWIIDYNHNKVYVKRNQNTIEDKFNRKVMYYAKVNREKLEIVVKEKSQTKFKLGDQVIAVNGQKVTEKNQCELQDLLNKTEDWNSLQLEVISNTQ